MASQISVTSTNDLYIYTQLRQDAPTTGNTPILLTKTEIIKSQQIGRASLKNSNLGGVVSNGVMKLCTAGCSDCSKG